MSFYQIKSLYLIFIFFLKTNSDFFISQFLDHSLRKCFDHKFIKQAKKERTSKMHAYKYMLLIVLLIQEFRRGFCVFQHLLPMSWQSDKIGDQTSNTSAEAYDSISSESVASINNNNYLASQYLSAPVFEPCQALIVDSSAAASAVSAPSSQSSTDDFRRRLSNYLSHKTNSHFIGKRGRDQLNQSVNKDASISSEVVNANEDTDNELAVSPREASFMEKILDRLSFSKKNANQLKKTCRNSFKERSILPFLIYKCNLIKF
jgi:hypothetical protein